MNVSSSLSTQMMQTTAMTSKNSNLSSEQKDLIEEVLSNYDTDALTASDASEIVEAFSMAGIEPSEALSTTMQDAGFDAQEVGDLANAAGATGTAGTGGGRPAGGPPPPPTAEEEEEVESIYDLLEALLETDDEEDDSTTTSILSGTGYDDSEGSSFETVLDYTSKIIRLKDDARSDVMSMLNDYSSNTANLDNEETQKNLLTSLSQILNKSDNYNTMSFYA